jgi:hypothetical protein
MIHRGIVFLFWIVSLIASLTVLWKWMSWWMRMLLVRTSIIYTCINVLCVLMFYWHMNIYAIYLYATSLPPLPLRNLSSISHSQSWKHSRNAVNLTLPSTLSTSSRPPPNLSRVSLRISLAIASMFKVACTPVLTCSSPRLLKTVSWPNWKCLWLCRLSKPSRRSIWILLLWRVSVLYWKGCAYTHLLSNIYIYIY